MKRLAFAVCALLVVGGPGWAQEDSMDAAKPGTVCLDIHPDGPHGSLFSCLPVTLQAAGADRSWTVSRLKTFLGLSFAFSMNPEGAGVWQGGNYEWSYFFRMLNHFKPGLSGIGVNGAGDHGVSAEEFARMQEAARDKVRASLAHGMPVVVWQPMTENTDVYTSMSATHSGDAAESTVASST